LSWSLLTRQRSGKWRKYDSVPSRTQLECQLIRFSASQSSASYQGTTEVQLQNVLSARELAAVISAPDAIFEPKPIIYSNVNACAFSQKRNKFHLPYVWCVQISLYVFWVLRSVSLQCPPTSDLNWEGKRTWSLLTNEGRKFQGMQYNHS
jgi:hypothetical protein